MGLVNILLRVWGIASVYFIARDFYYKEIDLWMMFIHFVVVVLWAHLEWSSWGKNHMLKERSHKSK